MTLSVAAYVKDSVSVNSTEMLILSISKQTVYYSLLPTTASFPTCFGLYLSGRGEGEISYACARAVRISYICVTLFFHIAVLQKLK